MGELISNVKVKEQFPDNSHQNQGEDYNIEEIDLGK